MKPSIQKSGRTSGILFLMAGVAFVAAAVIGHQPLFAAVATPFLALGAVSLRRASKADRS